MPKQRESELTLPVRSLDMPIFFRSLGGSPTAGFQGPCLQYPWGLPDAERRPWGEFLVFISRVDTAGSVFSSIAIYAVGKPRSVAAAAIEELVS